MSRGGPDVKAIFTAALKLPAGPDRENYLAAACGDDVALRGRLDELLAAYAKASEVLGPSGAAADATQANAATAKYTSNRDTDPDATAASWPGREGGQTVDHGLAWLLGGPELTATPGAPATESGDDRGLASGAKIRYFGDYEIRRELGRGGMGIVYEARQVSLNRPVALKMVKSGMLAGDDELRRFQNEAEAVALLDHPGIVPVYEVGDHDGQYYLSMKLVTGGSLVALVNRYKAAPKAAARLVAETAEAVAHAHARGILHRDLKPANILLDDQGHPHVTDFGLAKKVEADIEFTQSGAILGTPAYMSPEQATSRHGSITTATDVYGLGAVLYALLTGKAPFGGDSLVDTIDAVRNAPPEPPSRLNADAPRDLETIALKCLEKDPRRRYPTAQSLADDLKAWLDSRPIAARRVGVAERAWLWCKRKPAVAALSAAVLLATVVGTATVIAVQAKANADLRSANTRIEQRYDLAVEAIKTFHTGVSEDFLLTQDQFKELRDRLLKSAANFYGKLAALLGKETDLASRRALVASNFELADLTGKVGRSEDALAAHRAVLTSLEALAAAPGADVETKVEVGRSLTAIASLLTATGKVSEAKATYRKAEALLTDLARSSQSASAARPALAACRSELGFLLGETGKTTDALASYRLARADQEELAAAPGATKEARRDLAYTIHWIGKLLSETGKPTEAEAEYRQALAILQKLADDSPAVTQFRNSLARSHSNLGVLLSQTGKPAEAVAEYRQALTILQKLADDNPAVTRFRNNLASSHIGLGILLSQMGKPAEAEAEYRKALTLHQRLADDNPTITDFRNNLASNHIGLGAMLSQTGKPAEAAAEYRQALTILQKLADDNPAITDFRRRLAHSHNNLGFVLSLTGKPAEAETEYRKALALHQKLADDNPTLTNYQSGLAVSLSRMGLIQKRAGRTSEALASFRQAVAAMERLPAPTTMQRYDLACCQALLAGAAAEPGSGVPAAESRAEAERAMATLRQAVAGGYRDLANMRTDTDLDPLRSRPDFQLLMLDLAFPVQPFDQAG